MGDRSPLGFRVMDRIGRRIRQENGWYEPPVPTRLPFVAKRKRKSKKGAGGKPQPRPRIPYHEYLQSKWWKSRRKQYGKQAGWKCERCGGRGEIHIHHKTYERLWCEKNADLEALCRECHQHEHAPILEMNAHLDRIARMPD